MSKETELPHILRMPDVVFEHILSYLTHDGIARTRIVCRRFNNVSQRLLNRGFYAAVQLHTKLSKEVKSQLPRRESQRPTHPLARHNNILHAIETRLSLLKMTYCKFIQLNACCFIPGKVVDELFRVLRLVNNPKVDLVPHEVLTELRDISSMAMDYFEEKISPTLLIPNVLSPPPQSSPSSPMNVLSSPFSSKVPPLATSTRSPGAVYDSLNASMHVTLSSLSHCFGEVGGSGSNAFFPFSDDLLAGEMKNAIDSLVPPLQVSRPAPIQLVPVPAETLKALVQALSDTRGRKSRAERHLAMMQTKLLEVSRKVQDQERTISEQSRLLAEHSVRFSQHSRSIFEIVNNSVTAEFVDMDDGNISLLSVPDYESDMPEYSNTERGYDDDDGSFGYQVDEATVGSVKKGNRHDDSLDQQGIVRPESSQDMLAKRNVLAVGTKKHNTKDEKGVKGTRHDDSLDQQGIVRPESSQDIMLAKRNVLAVGTKKHNTKDEKGVEEEQNGLCRQFILGKMDSNILKPNERREEVRDILNVKESTPSQVDGILKSPSVTAPMSISRIFQKLMEMESSRSNKILDCNLAASTDGPSSAKYTPRANVHDGRANVVDGSRPSTSRGRLSFPPRCAVRPRFGRPLKASISSSSAARQFLNSKSLTTLLSSLVNSPQSGEAASPSSSRSVSSIKTLTRGQCSRLASHLRRLQASAPTSRSAGRRRNLSRSPASCTAGTPSHERTEGNCGSPGQSSRSRSTSAIRPPLLRTPDGRIIVIRPRSSGEGPSNVGNSRTEPESSELYARQQIHDPQPKVGSPGYSIYDFMNIIPTPEEIVKWNLPASLAYKKQRPCIRSIQHQKSIQQEFCVHLSGDDGGESEEEAAIAKHPSTHRVTGGEERKRKLGIAYPPVASVSRSKDIKDEDARLDSTPGSEEGSRDTLLNSNASSDDTASKSGVVVLTSEEESDDQNASPILKRPRVELLDELKKNYAD